jgi:RNA polymerase sigma factor (sigma-70 family)
VKPLPAFKRLKAEVIADLCERVRAGDLDARNALIQANMRLVAQIATRYAHAAGRLDLLDDMIQEAVAGASGRGGLIRAIELFDPERKQAFSTFAAFWIRDEVIAVLNRQKVVAASSNAAKRRARIRRARDSAQTRLGRDPSTFEVRDELIATGCRHQSSLSPATIERALSWSLAEVSFEWIQGDGSSDQHGAFSRDYDALIDRHAPDEDALVSAIDDEKQIAALKRALRKLDPEQRRLIERRFQLGRRGGSDRAASSPVGAKEREAMCKLREIMTGEKT